jgi:hypothetical protein
MNIKHTLITAAALLAFIPVAANAGEVHNRLNNETGRIDQGVHNGSVTYGEYHRLDRSEDRIQAQRRHDLRANGGSLTSGEKAQLNHEENNLSDRIYFDKHNTTNQR